MNNKTVKARMYKRMYDDYCKIAEEYPMIEEKFVLDQIERHVISYCIKGCSLKEIAASLRINPATVKKHLDKIEDKILDMQDLLDVCKDFHRFELSRSETDDDAQCPVNQRKIQEAAMDEVTRKGKAKQELEAATNYNWDESGYIKVPSAKELRGEE